MTTTRPDTTSSTRRRDNFSLAAVLDTLIADGVIEAAHGDAVRRSLVSKSAELKERFSTRDGEDPYVSPLELVASFGFPNPDGRTEQLSVVELSESYAFAQQMPFTRIDPLKLDARVLCSIVSRPFARRHLLVPIRLDGRRLTVAMVNPFDRTAVHQLEDVTGHAIVPTLGLRSEILKTINEIFAFEHSLQKAEALKSASDELANLEQLVGMMTDDELDASDQHIVKAVDLLFQYAFEQRASDIHIEPKRQRAAVRLRIDGRLHDTHSIPIQVYPSFLSRIKIMGRLDIAEKRKPQDGRIKSVFRDQEIELRLSTVPVAFGEKTVIRVFDPAILIQDIGSLGLHAEQKVAFERILGQPHGIILVTGPTGSGKTTTLYSSLQYLARPEVNIVTIEDPIEMVHDPFNQIAVQESAGVSFARALRSVLRQDPDIVMVGEIRDTETAQYAVQASLTGHLVFSTLHTNTAAGAVVRLADLGIERFLISSTVIGLLAQRLLRLVCVACAAPATITDDEAYLLGIEGDADTSRVRKGAGCQKCRNTGYYGRSAAYEVLEVTDRVRGMIRDGADEKTIVAQARRTGAQPLMGAAVRKLLSGHTTAEELLRVIPMTG